MGVNGTHYRAYDSGVLAAVVVVLAVELEGLFPRGRVEVILNDHEEFVGVGGLGCVVQTEGLAFEKHTVVVDQHRTINEFESAFAVILEVADCIEGVGIVSFGLDLEAKLDGLAWVILSP